MTDAAVSLPRSLPRHAAASDPVQLLRGEAAVTLALSLVGYHLLGGGWVAFLALFLVPDLSMVGYLAGPKIGAIAYNGAHTYLAPALLAVAAYSLHARDVVPLSLIWSAHVGFDRLLGYGLKLPEGFGVTHLGRIGGIR